MEPYFSVIVPVYNAQAYLRACVDSILAQTFADFELLLVDDGSPDGCPALCDEYAGRDQRVQVLHRPNAGVVAARRAGLDRARAEYICFVDADDYVADDLLESVRARAEENGRPDVFLFGLSHDFGARRQDAPLEIPGGYYDKARLRAEIVPHMLYDGSKPFFTKLLPGYLWNKIYRRELLLAHYIEDERIRVFEDVMMSYECVYHAQSAYVFSECFYRYRQNSASVMSVYKPDFLQNLKLCSDYFRGHLGRQAPEMLVSINAYLVMRVLDAAVLEYQHGFSFFQAAAHFRAGMRQTGLAEDLTLSGLAPKIRLFVFLLKRRCWACAAALAGVRYWQLKKRNLIGEGIT